MHDAGASSASASAPAESRRGAASGAGDGPAATEPRRSGGNLRRAIAMSLVVAVVVTAVSLLWRPAWAWLPAVIAAALFALVILVGRIDRRLRTPARLPRTPFGRREQVSAAEELPIATEHAFVIVGGFVALAVLLASIWLAWTVVALGSLLVLGWCLALGLPVWMAADPRKDGGRAATSATSAAPAASDDRRSR